jgi:hypothetical protein
MSDLTLLITASDISLKTRKFHAKSDAVPPRSKKIIKLNAF